MEPVNDNKDELVENVTTDEVKAEEVKAEETPEQETPAQETVVEAPAEAPEEAPAGETSTQEAATETPTEEAPIEATTEASAEETAVDATTETSTEDTSAEAEPEPPMDPEAAKAERAKKIKLGIVAAGGVFILLAIIYIAAIAGGKTKAIEDEKEPIIVVIPTEAPEEEAEPTVEVIEEEEETPEESLLAVVQGNARYEECYYGDGGSIIVRNGDKIGAIDYTGKEIVPLKYTDIEQLPTKEGMFVLSTSKTENVTEEKDGTTYSYEEVTTTYTLFDNTGKELYKGNNKVVATNDTYILGIEDKENARNTRVEYHKIGTKDKPFLTLYVNDQFSLNGFMDGMTTVMGFTAVPTEDQDTNPTNLYAGTMDEKGKVTWFAKAPGLDAFAKEVAQWKEDNKELQKNIKESNKKIEADNNKEKAVTKKSLQEAIDAIEYADNGEVTHIPMILLDKWGNDFEVEDLDARLAELKEELANMEDEEEIEADEETEAEETDEALEEEGTEEIADDTSNGPVFHMDEILNAPVGGFFIYKDLYDVEDPYSIYTDKGVWFADLDTAYLEADAKKGFRVGNFNNGAVELKGYVLDGEVYYNFGSYMVLHIGDKDVLIDISKGKGMTAESITDKIVVAIYDEINISAANYWMYKDGGKAGYLDLKGQPMKVVYDDATSFVNGYAIAIKNGKAIIINEKFEELEEVSEAKSVELSGDIMSITNSLGTRRYMLKETKENPRGNEIIDATAKDKEDPKATPEAEEKNSKKK